MATSGYGKAAVIHAEGSDAARYLDAGRGPVEHSDAGGAHVPRKDLHGGRHGSRNDVDLSADGEADDGDMARVRDEADDDVDLRHLGA